VSVAFRGKSDIAYLFVNAQKPKVTELLLELPTERLQRNWVEFGFKCIWS